MRDLNKFKQQVSGIYQLLIILLLLVVSAVVTILYLINNPDFLKNENATEYTSVSLENDQDKIENGIHLRTGLVAGDGLMETVQNCTNCHSAKLVIQNRMNRESWLTTIRWMQETQNLWDLGKNEEVIINYLVKNYPPNKKGRRQELSNINWYELKD